MSPSSPTPPVPTPHAVSMLQADRIPERVVIANAQADDAERMMRKLRGPLFSQENCAAREWASAMFAAADKVLATYPTRRVGGAR